MFDIDICLAQGQPRTREPANISCKLANLYLVRYLVRRNSDAKHNMFLQRKQLVLLNLLASQLLLLWPGMLQGFLVSLPRVSHAPSTAAKGCKTRPISAVMSGDSTPTGGVVHATGKRDSTWSNVGGEDLIQVSGDVWCAERPFVWNGIDVGELWVRIYIYICTTTAVQLTVVCVSLQDLDVMADYIVHLYHTTWITTYL